MLKTYEVVMARVDDVAAFVLEQCGTMTTYKLHKLLYYAQGWSLAWDGAPLFDAKIKAYENGPVVSTLFHDHRGAKHVHRWPSGRADGLTDEEADTVRAVLEKYGAKTAEELVEMTHAEPPWRDAWKGERSNAVEIPLEAMRAFFEAEAKRAAAAGPEAVAMASRLRSFLGSRGDS
jgi:uncharacterized phage-associated protein